MVNLRELLARFSRAYNRRQLWNIFGYPGAIQLDEYWLRYRRDGIASRIIRAYPDACWRTAPTVEDDAGNTATVGEEEFSTFVAAWEQLEREHSCLAYMHRLDRLSRVGHYAVLVLGFGDGAEMDAPLEGQAPLNYMAVYSERAAKVDTWEEDVTNPRFGLPLTYRVTPRADAGASSRRTSNSFTVHWSRIIHVAENLDEDDVFGEPALRPIWNYLLDLEKVAGAGAETFWLNARGGLAVEAAADSKMTEATAKDIKKQLDDYMDELRRTIAIVGAKVSPITAQVSDPGPNTELAFKLISGTTGIPSRLLLGSERGELASSQDASSWESRIDERNEQHCGPSILRPFVERMIETGNLPTPVGAWAIVWEESSTLTDAQRADIALKRAQAANTWAAGNADRAIALPELRISLGMPATSEYDLADDIDEDEDSLGADLEDDANDDMPVPPGPPSDDPPPQDPPQD